MIIATIPARGGSKGVPNKSIRLVGGHPLIAYSIAAAKLSKKIDRVIVSTDSNEIAKIAIKYGAEVPFLRPAEFAQDNSSDNQHIIHAINWFEINEKFTPELFVHLRPTTPLRDSTLIDDAIVKFKNTHDADSLRSTHECSESPFKWFMLKENDFYTGLNTDDMELLNRPRQEFPKVYIPNGYVDVLSVNFVKNTGKLHGKVVSFITPPCIEIDSEYDFKHLTAEVNLNKHTLLDYLNASVPK